MEVPEPVTVRCSALVLRDERLLLCHRRPDDVWVLPGGSPHRSEGGAACTEREVLQEAGLRIRAGGVAFVLDATSPSGDEHLFEIVFTARELDPSTVPEGQEDELEPTFVDVADLSKLPLRPRIGDQLRAFAAGATTPPVATYLGNVWEPAHGPSR